MENHRPIYKCSKSVFRQSSSPVLNWQLNHYTMEGNMQHVQYTVNDKFGGGQLKNKSSPKVIWEEHITKQMSVNHLDPYVYQS